MTGGLYVYGVVPTRTEERFGRIGIGDTSPEVFTIVVRDVGCLVSQWDEEAVEATVQQAQAHERVLLNVFERMTVLPFEFGTVAPDAEMVQQVLRCNLSRFRTALKKLSGKVEMQFSASWHDREQIFEEILDEHPAIARYKREIQRMPSDRGYQNRIRIGEMIATALQGKKQREAQRLVAIVRRRVLDLVLDDPSGDTTVLQGACLIWKDRVSAFEQVLEALDRRVAGRLNWKYTGPFPGYHFSQMPVRLW
jgi:hypothetical protein